MARNTRRVILTIGALCLVAAFMPWWSTARPSPNVEQRIVSIGPPVWPLFKFIKERMDNPDGTTTYSSGTMVLVSPVSAFLWGAGIVLIVLALRNRGGPANQ